VKLHVHWPSPKIVGSLSASVRRGARRVLDKVEVFLSWGVIFAEVGPDEADPAGMLAAVEQALADQSLGGRFSREINERFLRATEETRRRMFTGLSLGGTILYNLFLAIDVKTVPDVIGFATILQLCVATPITLTCIVLVHRRLATAHAMACVTLLAMTICALVILWYTRAPHADLMACVFSMFVLSCNVLVALPFRWALGLTTAINILVSTVALSAPALDATSSIFAVVTLSSASVYSLVGNYRIEAGARRAFLSALRESLCATLLAQVNTALRTQVHLDALTGLRNRRCYDETLALIWNESSDREVTLLMIDIDHFKKLNDVHGHASGDHCLRTVAGVLAGFSRRSSDFVARYGGEEFAFISHTLDRFSAFELAEDVRRAVAALEIDIGNGSPIGVTISIGGAVMTPVSGTTPADLFLASDAALYRAKNAGRNRTELARPALSQVPPMDNRVAA
jgi:diguanylate cyclase (GGDEF)-like protein